MCLQNLRRKPLRFQKVVSVETNYLHLLIAGAMPPTECGPGMCGQQLQQPEHFSLKKFPLEVRGRSPEIGMFDNRMFRKRICHVAS